MVSICTGFNTSDSMIGTSALRACKVQATENFTVGSLSCHPISAVGTVTLGIYSDNSGEPDALLAQTITAPAVSALTAYPLSSNVNVTSGTDYWIGLWLSETAGSKSQAGQPMGTQKAIPHFSDTLPNPFGVASNDTDGRQLCMNSAIPTPSTTRLPPPPIILSGF